MVLLVNEYFVPAVLALCLLGLWFAGGCREERERNQRLVLCAVMALLVANAVVTVSNAFYYRPRPFVTEAVNLLFYRPTDSSFPSNPTAVGFSLALPIWLANRRVGYFALAMASLFGLSRVYVGVHFPTDILGGMVVGVFSALVVVAAKPSLDPIFSWVIYLGRWFHLA